MKPESLPLLLALLGALAGVAHQGCTPTRFGVRPLASKPAHDDGAPRMCPLVVGSLRPVGPDSLRNGDVTNDITAVTTYLIRAHGQLILVDGGLVPVQQMVWWLRVLDGQPAYDVPPHAGAAAQLREAGIDPARISMVVATHAHGDHTGVAEMFPNAPLVMSADETTWVFHLLNPERELLTWRNREAWELALARVQAVHWQKPFLTTSLQSFDLFGDGSMVFVHTPGHTPGSMSIVLRHQDGTRSLLAGDAALTEESVRRNAPIGLFGRTLDVDADEAVATLGKLHDVVGQDSSWRVYTAHDARIMAERHRFIECVQAMMK